jgi:hypothetical protein
LKAFLSLGSQNNQGIITITVGTFNFIPDRKLQEFENEVLRATLIPEKHDVNNKFQIVRPSIPPPMVSPPYRGGGV